MPNPQYVESFAALQARKRALEAELREVKDQIAPIETALLDEFMAENIRSINTGDGATVYAHTSTLVGGDTALLWSLFSDNGLLDLITINHSKLRAWYSEMEREGAIETIPSTVRDALKVERKVSLRIRG